MNLKKYIKNAVDLDSPKASKINLVLANLLKYFNKLYDKKSNNSNSTQHNVKNWKGTQFFLCSCFQIKGTEFLLYIRYEGWWYSINIAIYSTKGKNFNILNKFRHIKLNENFHGNNCYMLILIFECSALKSEQIMSRSVMLYELSNR